MSENQKDLIKTENPSKLSKFIIKESNLVAALVCILIPFVLITIAMTVWPKFAFIMPFLCMSQCQGKTKNDYYEFINFSMQFVIADYAVINITCMICLFLIRHVSKVFSAGTELRQVVGIMVITFGFEIMSLLFLDQTTFVVLGYYQYFTISACIILLYLTALKPIS